MMGQRLSGALSGLVFEARIYVLVFVAIIFSGSLFRSITPYLIVFLPVLLLWMSVTMPSKTATAWANKRHLLLPGLLLLFSLFLWWQTSVAMVPAITQTYARRFALFAVMLILIPQPNVLVAAIKAAKHYSWLVALSIVAMTLATGLKSGGLVGTYQFGGMMMSIGCLLSLIDYFVDGGKRLDGLGFALALVALLISGKRMFALLVVLGFVLLYLQTRRRAGLMRALRLAIAGLLVLGPVYVLIPSVRELAVRMQLLTMDPFTATSGRNRLWAAAGDLFQSNPLIGIGFGNFAVYLGSNYGVSKMGQYLTHNIYYGLLAETGIVGFALVVSLMIVGISQSVLLLRRMPSGHDGRHYYLLTCALVLQVWFAVYGLTGNGIYDWHEMFIYVSALAMFLSVQLDHDTGRERVSSQLGVR